MLIKFGLYYISLNLEVIIYMTPTTHYIHSTVMNEVIHKKMKD